ncbi:MULTISPECIES: DUF5302 domain-containing protein [Actinokineospora]|uniref:DUF5302 domain-containing protein n=1 Tax=Actinokineospora fastidiosa TaxID=1816 RepID=A0A918LAJ1_9PSEU|nr:MULTISPECIES: DUF5302 domain-containing protein [Actinokineospora]UVS81638.1 hypothetical protein Actkin_05400 [Actinokineospora sp. UTMC 2448]GGS26290.1 hypothetical protein GCM10010171_19690 [Actinokineospora fastidiosa]
MADTPEPTAETEVDAQPADVREQFKAALARKNAKASEGEKHLNTGSKVHDAHGKVGGKRQFRRKSG